MFARGNGKSLRSITKLTEYILFIDALLEAKIIFARFDWIRHDSFRQWVRDTSKNNFVFVSEYNAPKDFKCVWSKVLTTTLDKSSRSTATEKLFTYNSNMMK